MGIALIVSAVLVSAALLMQVRSTPRIIERTEPVIVASFDTVTIPVPAKLVPMGTRVRDIPIKSTTLPKNQVPEGALTSLESVMEAVTVAPLPANLPFYQENLSLVQPGNPVIESIPDGMRAIAIQVDATSAVEGWVSSGTVVDVLLVSKEVTTVIAEKVKILSTGRSTHPVQGGASPAVPSTITLLVTQDQAIKIVTAIPRGKIALTLRNLRDDESWRAPIFVADRLNGMSEHSPSSKSLVSGVIKMGDSTDGKAFVLVNGKWLPSDTLPEGFLPMQARAVTAPRGDPQ